MTGPKQVSEKQLAANRANARHSTGPRTPEGKAVSRYNALKHGILARAVIPDALAGLESQEDFDQLLAALGDYFVPSGVMEELLVQQIAVAYWRLSRLYRAEAGTIAQQNDRREEASQLGPLPLADLIDLGARLLAEQKALEAVLDDEPALRAHLLRYGPVSPDDTIEDLDRYARDLLATLRGRRREYLRRKRIVEKDCDSMPPVKIAVTLARYETSLQNQLDRLPLPSGALFRLERLRLSSPLPSAPLLSDPLPRGPLPALEQSDDA